MWKASRVCFGLATAVLLVLLLCEASNPGPKGHSDADSALACALLESSCLKFLNPGKGRVGTEALALLMLMMPLGPRLAKGKGNLPRPRVWGVMTPTVLVLLTA